MGGPHRYLSPRASAEPGRYRTDRTPYMRAIMDALSPIASGASGRGHEVGAGRRHRSRQQLDRLRHPSRAGPDAGGAADRRTGQAVLAPTHRAADRRKPGAAGAGEAVPLARRRQHGAVEGVSGRACWSSPAPTARSACARCRRATCSSTRSMPIRHRPTRKAIRLRSPRRARGRSRGDPRSCSPRRRRSRHLADRAGIRGVGPAPLLRAVPALRGDAMASVRAAALGQGPARDHTLYMCVLRRPDRGTPQDRRCSQAGEWRADGAERRSRHDRFPHLGALFAGRLVVLGRYRADVRGRAGHRRGQAQLQERRARSRPGSRPARRRTGSGSTSGARLGRSARSRLAGCS